MKKTKSRYSWWSYIKEIIQTYPDVRMTLTSGVVTKEVDSVLRAINTTERMGDGEARLKVIRMVHWDKTHTLEGAAMEANCDRATAARWQRRFFEEVARNRGLLD